MGFIGLIRLIALALVAWLLWRLVKRKQLDHKPTDRTLEQKMVQCKVCGTHVPRSDAFEKEQQWYCSTEHRDQDTP